MPSNVFSNLNINIPIWIEWVDMNDSENKVRFREKIFLRLVKEAMLSNENIKKDIDTEPQDVFSILLHQIVSD